MVTNSIVTCLTLFIIWVQHVSNHLRRCKIIWKKTNYFRLLLVHADEYVQFGHGVRRDSNDDAAFTSFQGVFVDANHCLAVFHVVDAYEVDDSCNRDVTWIFEYFSFSSFLVSISSRSNERSRLSVISFSRAREILTIHLQVQSIQQNDVVGVLFRNHPVVSFFTHDVFANVEVSEMHGSVWLEISTLFFFFFFFF